MGPGYLVILLGVGLVVFGGIVTLPWFRRTRATAFQE